MKDRVVFDCMVFLQAAARRMGPAGSCLQLALDGKVDLCISTPILEEIREVLGRNSIRKKFPGLTDEAVSSLLADVVRVSVTPDSIPEVVSLPRDPKDEKYLNLAIASNAKYLVSRDKDLLDLAYDPQFLRTYPDLKIVDPREFLSMLEPTSSD